MYLEQQQTGETAVTITLANLIAAVAIFLASYLIPQYDWDLLGHLGSALSHGIGDTSELHKTVYSLLQSTASQDVIADLTQGNRERTIWFQDAEAFAQTLPFYQPRVLITIPTFLAYELNINPIVFIHVFTSLAAALGYWFFYLAARQLLGTGGLLLLPLFALAAGTLEVARFEGADSVSFLFFAVFFYLLTNKNRWCFACIALFPAARSDMILMSVILLPLLYLVFRKDVLLLLISACLAVATYLIVNGVYGNYGWKTQFYVAAVQYLAYPADEMVPFNLSMYVKGVFNGMNHLIYNKTFIYILIVVVSAIALIVNNTKKHKLFTNTSLILLLSLLIFIITHFFVFPRMHVRYFAAQYFTILIIFFQVVERNYLRE